MTDNTKMRESVLKILASYKQEMERYGYYSSNPGVSVDDFEEIADEIVAWQAAQSVPVMGEAFQLDCYDAGLLGYEHLPNAEQWHDYIRSELARAHDFYQDQFDSLCSPPLAVMGSPVAWTSPEWLKEKGKLHGMTRPHPSFKVPLYSAPNTSITRAELDALRKEAERFQAVVIISQAALCLPSTRTDEANRMLSAYQAAVNAGLGIEPAIDAAMQERQP